MTTPHDDTPRAMERRVDRALILFMVPVTVVLLAVLVGLVVFFSQSQRSGAHCVELHRRALRRDIALLIRDPHHPFPADDGIDCSATP